MSTRLTNKGHVMVDSHSLQLVFACGSINDRIGLYLAQQLRAQGYEHASPSMLGFLGQLECGVNYASEIARRVGVSRQLVARTVKELCQAGYLEQADGPGRQKQILFTDTGESLMAAARALLAQLDQRFATRFSGKQLATLVRQLQSLEQLTSELVNTASS